MADIVTAPGPWDEDKLTVFLSGCMTDWRAEVIECLDDLDVQILDPTRDDYDSLSDDDLFAQRAWEADGLERADLRIFVFLEDEPSPTTLMEFGQYAHLPSVCATEPGFVISDQVEFICEREGVPIFNSLEDIIEQMRPALIEAGAVANQANKTASPDFGYSDFNDRDEDLEELKYKIYKGIDSDPEGFSVYAYLDNKPVGHIDCVPEDFSDQPAVGPSWIEISQRWKGTGLGQILYDKAIQQAKKQKFRWFISDSSLSQEAINAWGRLEKRYKVVRVPMAATITSGENEDEFTDSFAIDLKNVSKMASIPEPWRNSSYARSVELVPIEELKRYREYNRLNPSEAMTDDPDTYIDELTEDIKKNGIREPLILEYSQNTGRALLTEGNHRLLAAERISDLNGMVPVRGYRRYGPFRGAHKGVVPPENNFGKDIFGKEYVPQDFKPSVIGVGGTSQGMTA